MESDISVLGEAPNRSKRPSVGPAENDESVEPSVRSASPHARKRARISNEADPAIIIKQYIRSATPGSPVMTTATQLLFGSSPLTEPEDDFPTPAGERDAEEQLDQAVLSSQQAEREGLVPEKSQEMDVSQGSDIAVKMPVNAPMQSEAKEQSKRDDADTYPVQTAEAMQEESSIYIPVVSTVQAGESNAMIPNETDSKAVMDFEPAPVMVVDQDRAAEADHDTVNQDQATTIVQEQAVSEQPESHPAPPITVIDKKKDITNDDEFDDEFDNDPWFDDACLKSFDAIEPILQESARDLPEGTSRTKTSASGSSMFQTAGGGALPEVSEGAKVASAAIFNQIDEASALTHTLPLNIQQEEPVVRSFIDTRPVEQIREHEIPAVVGFSTGRGRKVAISTEAAAAKNARVAKLMQELMDIRNEAEGAGAGEAKGESEPENASSHEGKEAFTRARIGSPRISQAVFETPKKTDVSAFTTAAGSQLGAISASAREAVTTIFDAEPALPQEHVESKKPALVLAEKPMASLFATASGTTLSTPSVEARKMATALFDDFGPDIHTHRAASTDYPLQPANPAVLSLALPDNIFETPMKSVSRRLIDCAQAAVLETPQPSAVRHAGLQDISNLQPSSPAKQPHIGSKTPLPSKTLHRASQAKPFQTPLPSNKQRAISPAPSTAQGLSPALPRRVGLGMTPRARSGLVERPRFVSPFRTSVRDEVGELVGSPNAKPKSGMRAIFSAPSARKATKVTEKARILQPCFDLTCPTKRTSMIEAGLRPNATASSVLTAGLPPEICAINAATAGFYTFLEGGIMKGPEDVLREFQNGGLTHVGIQWVQNHWKMILWKLASIVRTNHHLFSEKWNYREVVRQLKYRYEREINRAHRSAVKRIQEQDSPASMPVILCVSGIIDLPADTASEEGIPTDRQALELTDGWYSIHANVDATMSRALKAGKLRVGYKIGVAGAKLDASREGTEVLEAMNKSSLRITGNSTSLVEWYRPLGFTYKPFISTMRSLSPDGGNIPLLDVRVTKVFPLAYITTEKGKGGSPWSAEEEYKLQDEWNERYMQERSRLQADSERRMRGFEEDVEHLRSAIEGIDGSMDAYPCEDEELDLFRAAPNKSQHLKRMPGSAVLSLYMKAKEDFQTEVVNAQAEMEDQIRRLCPPRTTRSFQVIRVVDAVTSRYPQLREAQLQVWDAKALGDKMLLEGARYQVSNLIPAQQKAWATFRDKGEIYLSTSKATTWKRRDD